MYLHCARINSPIEYINPNNKESVVLVDAKGNIQNFPGILEEDSWISLLKNEKYLEPRVRFSIELEVYDEENYIIIWEIRPDGRYWEDENGFGGT